jgi:hypothetical protein
MPLHAAPRPANAKATLCIRIVTLRRKVLCLTMESRPLSDILNSRAKSLLGKLMRANHD